MVMQSQKKPKRIGKKGGKRRKKTQGPRQVHDTKKSKKTLLFVPNFEKDDPQTQAYVSFKEPSIVRLNIR